METSTEEFNRANESANYTTTSLGGHCQSDAIFTDHGQWWSGEMSRHTFAVPAVIPALDQSLNYFFVLEWN